MFMKRGILHKLLEFFNCYEKDNQVVSLVLKTLLQIWFVQIYLGFFLCTYFCAFQCLWFTNTYSKERFY